LFDSYSFIFAVLLAITVVVPAFGFHPGERDCLIPTIAKSYWSQLPVSGFHPGERDCLIPTLALYFTNFSFHSVSIPASGIV